MKKSRFGPRDAEPQNGVLSFDTLLNKVNLPVASTPTMAQNVEKDKVEDRRGFETQRGETPKFEHKPFKPDWSRRDNSNEEANFRRDLPRRDSRDFNYDDDRRDTVRKTSRDFDLGRRDSRDFDADRRDMDFRRVSGPARSRSRSPRNYPDPVKISDTRRRSNAGIENLGLAPSFRPRQNSPPRRFTESRDNFRQNEWSKFGRNEPPLLDRRESWQDSNYRNNRSPSRAGSPVSNTEYRNRSPRAGSPMSNDYRNRSPRAVSPTNDFRTRSPRATSPPVSAEFARKASYNDRVTESDRNKPTYSSSRTDSDRNLYFKPNNEYSSFRGNSEDYPANSRANSDYRLNNDFDRNQRPVHHERRENWNDSYRPSVRSRSPVRGRVATPPRNRPLSPKLRPLSPIRNRPLSPRYDNDSPRQGINRERLYSDRKRDYSPSERVDNLRKNRSLSRSPSPNSQYPPVYDRRTSVRSRSPRRDDYSPLPDNLDDRRPRSPVRSGGAFRNDSVYAVNSKPAEWARPAAPRFNELPRRDNDNAFYSANKFSGSEKKSFGRFPNRPPFRGNFMNVNRRFSNENERQVQETRRFDYNLIPRNESAQNAKVYNRDWDEQVVPHSPKKTYMNSNPNYSNEENFQVAPERSIEEKEADSVLENTEPLISREELLTRIEKLDTDINILESKLDRTKNVPVLESIENTDPSENVIASNTINLFLASIQDKVRPYLGSKLRYSNLKCQDSQTTNTEVKSEKNPSATSALIHGIYAENRCRASFSNQPIILTRQRLFQKLSNFECASLQTSSFPENEHQARVSREFSSALKLENVKSRISCYENALSNPNIFKNDIFDTSRSELFKSLKFDDGNIVNHVVSDITPIYKSFSDYPLCQKNLLTSFSPSCVQKIFEGLKARNSDFISKCAALYEQRENFQKEYVKIMEKKLASRAGRTYTEEENTRKLDLEKEDADRLANFETLISGSRHSSVSSAAVQAEFGSQSSLSLLDKLELLMEQIGPSRANRVIRGPGGTGRDEVEVPGQSAKANKNYETTISKMHEEEKKRRRVERNCIPATQIPNMLLLPADKQQFDTFLNRNELVEDAMQDERDRRNLNPWTEEEKTRYAKFPKRFHKIAEGLPNKTVNECVVFYYSANSSVHYKKIARSGRRAGFNVRKNRSRELANLGVEIKTSAIEIAEDEEDEEHNHTVAFGGGFNGLSTFSLYGTSVPVVNNSNAFQFSSNSILPIVPDVFPVGVVNYSNPTTAPFLLKNCIAYELKQSPPVKAVALSRFTRNRAVTNKTDSQIAAHMQDDTRVDSMDEGDADPEKKYNEEGFRNPESSRNLKDYSNSPLPSENFVSSVDKSKFSSHDDYLLFSLAKHIVSSNSRFHDWTDSELEVFIGSLNGSDFDVIASTLSKTKTSEQCAELWERIYKKLPLVALALNAKNVANMNESRFGPHVQIPDGWTEEELQVFSEKMSNFDGDWNQICTFLPGHSEDEIRALAIADGYNLSNYEYRGDNDAVEMDCDNTNDQDDEMNRKEDELDNLAEYEDNENGDELVDNLRKQDFNEIEERIEGADDGFEVDHDDDYSSAGSDPEKHDDYDINNTDIYDPKEKSQNDIENDEAPNKFNEPTITPE